MSVAPAPTGIYILIAVGAVMMFVGFLGCYGAIQESQCLLGTVRSGEGGCRAGGGGGGRTRSPGLVPEVEPVPALPLRPGRPSAEGQGSEVLRPVPSSEL